MKAEFSCAVGSSDYYTCCLYYICSSSTYITSPAAVLPNKKLHNDIVSYTQILYILLYITTVRFHGHYHIANCNTSLGKFIVKISGVQRSRGPGLDLYAHNLGEDNSTVIG